VPPALMPHAAFTVGIDHLREVAELAKAQGAMITTHASENDRENADTVAATGCRPIAALDSAGVVALGPVLAHGVRLQGGELQRLAETGASIAHCPGSNLKLASGAADLVGYRAEGIRVGLGTDGCSSSNDLDMFAVMRLTANLARLVSGDPAAISARDVVACATLEGARAVGLADRIGTVEVGKEADLIVVNVTAPHLVPMHDPYTSVVFSAGRADVRDVLVDGEVVVRGRRPTRIDVDEVLAAATVVVGKRT
jgi:5-methylthioadenosine/S-adenosylhomocysteine deaminase